MIDTNLAEDAELGTFATGEAYGATGRSLLLFALDPDADETPGIEGARCHAGTRPIAEPAAA